jgi:hypothetical protein
MPAQQEEKTGTMSSFYDSDTGIIREDGSGSNHDFYHPGANVQFAQGDLVGFLKITLPNGRVIVNDIKKRVN